MIPIKKVSPDLSKTKNEIKLNIQRWSRMVVCTLTNHKGHSKFEYSYSFLFSSLIHGLNYQVTYVPMYMSCLTSNTNSQEKKVRACPRTRRRRRKFSSATGETGADVDVTMAESPKVRSLVSARKLHRYRVQVSRGAPAFYNQDGRVDDTWLCCAVY